MSSPVRLGLAILFATAACSPETDEASEIDPTATPRVSAPAAFTFALDTLWRVTSGDSGAALEEPAFVAAGSGGVWISDRLRGLVALDLHGAHRWSMRDDPRLNSRSLSTAALAVASDSTVVLADRSGRRLLIARQDGRGIREVLLDEAWTPNTLCLPSGVGVLVAGGESPLGLVDRTSSRVTPVEFPWPALRDSSRLLQQVVMASTPQGDGCVVASAFGGGFATTDDGTTFRVHPTRETVPLPRVAETVDSTASSVTRAARLLDHTPAALQVAASDSLIVIAFGGTTPLRLGLLDVYRRGSGAYLGSTTVGSPVRGLAMQGDTLFVLHSLEDRVALTALRLVASSAPPVS